MKPQFERTALILGNDSIQKLQQSHVIIFGLGGVGGYVCEALVRAGVGEISLVDDDDVNESNINRQIIALHSTIGKAKVDVAAERALDINPEIKIHRHKCFYLPENSSDFDFSKYDYIVDCIDTVTAKISMIENAARAGKADKIITCLGTGNKINPMGFKVAAVEKTKVCPLARVMRQELKKRNIKGIKCVYSEELPFNVVASSENGRHAPGSVSFVPGAAGLLIAAEVIKDLTK